jgi:hypothetical protein
MKEEHTQMNKFILLALIVGGTCLLFWGVRAHKATDSDISFYLTGSAADASMGIVIAGALTATIGATGFLRDDKRNRSS